MDLPNWLLLSRHRPVRELAREDGGSTAVELRRRAAGIVNRNALPAAEAVAAIRAIQEKALRQPLPDSTLLIRADRDGR